MTQAHTPYRISIMFPASTGNKVQMVRDLRILTGVSLKQAVDAINQPGIYHDFTVADNSQNLRTELISNLTSSLTSLGCTIIHNGYTAIIMGLKKLANDAIQINREDLATEILQMLLTEKLRNPT